MIDRGELTVIGKALLELVANFLCRRRVGRASGQEKGQRNGPQGFHLERYRVANALQEGGGTRQMTSFRIKAIRTL